jgi:RNA 3'-terminal phosphate cyclase (ATP)
MSNVRSTSEGSSLLTIDGSRGEGGGQILRTALSLSMITGLPFRIEKIRAGRKKPGLLRQHLTCVEASKRISNAKVDGAEIGATSLTFIPNAIQGGTYTFAVGSAGSTTLVFQTILPALLQAKEPSFVTLSGGTHNPMAPTFDYLERAFLPQLARMGAHVETKLHRHGFAPAGGGRWHARITPAPLKPLTLEDAGAPAGRRVIADVANLPYEIAERECAVTLDLLGWPRELATAREVKADGPGNVLAVEIAHANVTELITGFGARNTSAEALAGNVAREVRAYLAAKVPVGQHLSDQLLLPLALAGSGSFVTQEATPHTRTNIEIIELFLPVDFVTQELAGGQWRVTINA